MLRFSDFTYVPGSNAGGTVLVPSYFLVGEPGFLEGKVEVEDLAGRKVTYECAGKTYRSDGDIATRRLVGWSYWESEATEDPDAPCINLMVLAADFNEADY